MKIATTDGAPRSGGRDTAGNENSANVFPTKVVAVELVAGGATGTADDVDVFTVGSFGAGGAANGLPFRGTLVDFFVRIDDNVAGASITPRTAVGGGGAALCEAASGNAAGLARAAGNAFVPPVTLARGSKVYLYRSDRALTGMAYLMFAVETE